VTKFLRFALLLSVGFITVGQLARGQTQYLIGNPTNEEQYMLELINRARADGGAEATRLGLSGLQEGPPNYNGETWIIDNTNQPLSWNPVLFNAAQNHANELNNGDQFFVGGNPHNYGGMTPEERIAAAGYSEGNYTGPTTTSGFIPGPENIAEAISQGSGPFTGTHLIMAVTDAHDGLFTDQTVPSRGHRNTMMLGFFREIGIGMSAGTDNQSHPGQPGGPGDTIWDSLYIVQDYGTDTSDTPFVTGVVYQDKNGNNFYDPGEGVGGVRVDVQGSGFFAITTSSGGYAVPISDNGSFPITFSGGSLATATGTAVVADLLSTKVDYLALTLAGITAVAPINSGLEVSFNAIRGRMYRLERKPNMTDAQWQSINGVADFHAGSTGVAHIADPNATNLTKAFYHVHLLP
jgi:hypothetical protein